MDSQVLAQIGYHLEIHAFDAPGVSDGAMALDSTTRASPFDDSRESYDPFPRASEKNHGDG